MELIVSILKVLHVVPAVLRPWPFYALVAVNNRAGLGPPLGDRVDTYMESIIKNRTIPCFVFQATALITGLTLILLRGVGLGVLVTNAVLGAKFLLLLLIAGVLLYVHFTLQPAIDRSFAAAGGSTMTKDLAAQIQTLRLRRKRLASGCLFAVLTRVLLGGRVGAPSRGGLAAVLGAAIGASTGRASPGVPPHGWA